MRQGKEGWVGKKLKTQTEADSQADKLTERIKGGVKARKEDHEERQRKRL